MTRIVSPVTRIQIGGKNGDVFVSGDGILQSVSVELGEDKRSSKCQVVLLDKGLLIGAKYQAISFAAGGIQVDSEVLKEVTPSVAPSTPSSDPSSVTTSGSSAQTATSEKPELLAFLDTIAYAEGGNYDILYGGKRFGSYAKHPGGGAAGRYQIQPRTWAGAQKALGLKDFSPASQDAAAIYLIQQRKAMPFVEQGAKGFRKALDILSYEWASFPPQRYPNQSVKKLEDLEVTYVRALRKYQRQSPAQSASAGQPQSDKAVPLKDKADFKPFEKSAKGTEIIVELGFNLGQMVAFHFVHIGTDTGRGSLDTTTFQGQSIRWLLTRRTQNTAYTKITLRQLAQKICDRYGLKLYMEGSGPLYQYLDATQVTDYELILREALAIGYTVREDKNTLILAPVRPNFTGFVITRDILQNIKFGDRASTDRATTPGTTTSTPAATAADSKTKNDRKTGKPTQTKTEDTSGMGDRRLKPFGVTGAATSAVHGTAIPDASITGLPKQEIGSIDLADDRRAQAVDLQNEQRRVRGYESSCTLVTTPEVLTLVPGSILGISDEVGPPPFNREFRVASVRHTLSIAGMRTEVQMYSPQAAKADSSTTGTSGMATSSSPASVTEVKPGGFVLPCTGRTGNGVNGGGNGKRRHHGVDIANVQGTAIVASASGVVYKVINGCGVGDFGCGGGYGNNVVIQHDNGYFTRYAHLSQIFVVQGQRVKQGEKIAAMGNTGRSYGSHLHFEIRKGGSFTDQAVVFSTVGLIIPQPHDVGFKY
jgi:muramidase (phage lysozyme)/biotin carboxyl carrier protein